MHVTNGYALMTTKEKQGYNLFIQYHLRQFMKANPTLGSKFVQAVELNKQLSYLYAKHDLAQYAKD